MPPNSIWPPPSTLLQRKMNIHGLLLYLFLSPFPKAFDFSSFRRFPEMFIAGKTRYTSPWCSLHLQNYWSNSENGNLCWLLDVSYVHVQLLHRLPLKWYLFNGGVWLWEHQIRNQCEKLCLVDNTTDFWISSPAWFLFFAMVSGILDIIQGTSESIVAPYSFAQR